ncbi:MAG: VWA domain-containing protein [Methylococcaceae bacterium]|nr:VWA domain-containing protein [Methylococcaceae bacterium]
MNISDFHFIRPYFLLAVIPCIAIIVFLVRSRLSQGNWTAVCDEALLPYLLQDKAVTQSRWPLATGAIAAFCAIVALAGPTWERLPTPVFRNDSALVLVLDLSRSMDAADIKPSRLTMARYKIADILKQRKDGQTALVTFSGDAFTVTPLTNDTDTIDNQLSALTTEIMPSDGNNIGRALEKSEALFKQAGLQQGQILLLTDGGNVDDTIAIAKSLDAYQLLVLGVGTPEGAPIALPTGGFLKDDQGGIIVDKLDSNGLEKLAQAGNGTYQPITTDDADIKNLLSTVDAQTREKGEKNENLLLDQWSDKGPWLLLLVVPLAALSFRKGLLCLALMTLLPLPRNSYALDANKVWQDLWQTKDQQAQEAYNNKEYDKASELFKNPDWKAAAQYKSGTYDKAIENLKNNTSANGLYNQGNALAQSGQLKEALEAYNKSLKLNPADEDAKFNKELVEKELEKQKQDQQQQDQNQQNKDKDSKDNKNQDQNKSDDKSDESKQDNNQENKEEQKDSEQKASDKKPEQKPEQSQESTQNQPEKKDAGEQPKPDEAKNQSAKPEQAEKPDQQKNDDKKDSHPAEPLDTMSKEEQQASEQWLKRIPDDPAGLLRRKFQYQYEQQRGQH